MDPEQQARLVSELRKNLAEQRLLFAQQQASGRRPASFCRSFSGPSGFSIALVAFAIVGLAVVAALAPGAPAVRVACIAARRGWVRAPGRGDRGAATALAPSTRGDDRVQPASNASSPAWPSSPARSACPTRRVTPTSRPPPRPSKPRGLSSERATKIAAERRPRLQRRKFAHESLALAFEDLEAERARFAAWKLAHGLAPALSPDGVLESLTALQAAWKDLGALDRVDAKIDQLTAEVSHFEARLARLSAGLSERGGAVESLEADPAGGLDELCALLAEVAETRATRTSLLQVVEDASAELERSFGLGPHARRLRAELETGELLAWTEEQAESRARALRGRPSPRTARAGPSGRVQRALRGLPARPGYRRLEQTRLALEQDLEEVLKSWAVLGCARLLLERTLAAP